MEQTVLVMLTNGVRRSCIEATAESARAALPDDGVRRIIAADTTDPVALDWLRSLDGWEVQSTRRRRSPYEMVYVGKRKGLVRVRRKGYSAAVAAGIGCALATGLPWIFWLEDDFTFDGPVPLADMQRVMAGNPQVAQMALVRHPWYPYEVEAGSVLNIEAQAYTQRDGWIEHRRWWTMNPMLTRRAVFETYRWPTRRPESEFHFGQRLRSDPRGWTFGFWGQVDDAPRVRHIGVDRAGQSY